MLVQGHNQIVQLAVDLTQGLRMFMLWLSAGSNVQDQPRPVDTLGTGVHMLH